MPQTARQPFPVGEPRPQWTFIGGAGVVLFEYDTRIIDRWPRFARECRKDHRQVDPVGGQARARTHQAEAATSNGAGGRSPAHRRRRPSRRASSSRAT
jgi:hypothetical protein